ncbi:MAG TPA: hypothetical protein VNG71_20450, partial [Pyrinomonadaceae bacterium]|nr:hypothetical protein [Pyrinomonadaceae bacterium]
MLDEYAVRLEALREVGQYPIPNEIQKTLVDGDQDDKEEAIKRLTELERKIPFGRRLRGAIQKDVGLEQPRNFALHNGEVFSATCALAIDPTINKCVTGLSDPPTSLLLRLGSFLHDIGKALDQARHPILGWHILVDLCSVAGPDKEDKNLLIGGLRDLGVPSPEVFFRSLAGLVRDHDKFGNLTTGEASYVILDSLIQFGASSFPTGLSVGQVDLLWCLNVADIAGTKAAQARTGEPGVELAGKLVRPDIADYLEQDLGKVQPVFRNIETATITDDLRVRSESREATVERIRRILVARADKWPGLSERFTGDHIQAVLETHFAPRNLTAFCRDFAMVAKLDYALQFWSELADFVYVTESIAAASLDIEITDAFEAAERVGDPALPSNWNLANRDFRRGEKGEWVQMIILTVGKAKLGKTLCDLL